MDVFTVIVLLASAGAGAVSSVVSFGVGSLLTPLLAVKVGTKLAVAAVSIAHLLANGLRFYLLRSHVDLPVLLRFGLASAAGGLIGALLHARASSPALGVIFGALLMLVGASEITGFLRGRRFGRRMAWGAGGLSGFLGGLVGNQGGIRAAALLGFNITKETFVATATAIALVVDAARMPVYFATQAGALLRIWPLIMTSAAGAVAGTLLGHRVFAFVPQLRFRRLVGGLVLVLGAYMLARSGLCHLSGT
jgi:hypothetical protein